MLDKSPFDGVKIPPEDKMKKTTKEILVYSEPQKKKMYAKIDEEFKNDILSTHRYSPAFSFILNTGLRECELLGFKWEHME